MQSYPAFAKSLTGEEAGPVRYSICTLVTRPDEYAGCVRSFVSHGFGEDDCEYLYADNSEGNRFDGYTGVNAFLSRARGEFVILVHQDVVLLADDRETLDRRLGEVSALDPLWAVCGNAGTSPEGETAISISDPYGEQRIGRFPCAVTALDENFLVVRRRANLGVTPRLNGFHFYGAELAFVAAILGMKSYVIDFYVRHQSAGRKDAVYRAARRAWMSFRCRSLRSRTVASTATRMVISPNPLLAWLGNRLFQSGGGGAARLVFRLTARG
jgi:hypothetical protein